MRGRATILRDALAVAIGGVLLGMAANALSPRGLSLTRDYFPDAAAPSRTSAAGLNAGRGAPAAPAAAETAASATRTKRGLPLVGLAEVKRLFEDPRRIEQRILFIDARDEAHFAAGHIPGALEFDHYHPELGMAAVLAPAQLAERIVVYCTGGDCEDSELATLDLISLGVPADKLVVYGGGIGEWQRAGLPLETSKGAGG